MKRFVAGLVVVASFAAFPPAHADTGAFVVLAGSDTLAVERYARTATRLEGELAVRYAGLRIHYVLDRASDGASEHMRLRIGRLSDPPEGAPLQEAVVRFPGDSVIVEKRPGGTDRQKSVRHATVFLNPSFALMQDAVVRAVRQNRSDPVVPVFQLEGGATHDVRFRRVGGDSLVAEMGGIAVEFRVDAEGAIRGARIPSQGLRIERASASIAPLAGTAPPDYSAPPDAPYVAEDVRVACPAGFALAGTYTRPRGSERVPAVLLLNGSGPQDRDEALSIVPGYRPMRQIADTLARRGIATLRLDDRGVGGSGGAMNATMADFADDARAAIAWLRERADVDPDRVAILGHSEGGIVAPMVAADDPRLRAIVLMAAPAWIGRRVIDYQNREAIAGLSGMNRARADSMERAARTTLDSLARTNRWLEHYLAHDPRAVAKRVRTSVRIVQGETDHQVTPEQAAELAAAFRAGGNRDVSVRTWPKTNHLFLPDADGRPALYAALPEKRVAPAILGDLADWLAGRLAAR